MLTRQECPGKSVRELLALGAVETFEDEVADLMRKRETLPLTRIALVDDDHRKVFALAASREAHQAGEACWAGRTRADPADGAT